MASDTAKSEITDTAVPIILFKEDHKFELDRKALEQLLLRPEVKDRSVAVLSIAGAFRKGKSFILNFFLMYMYRIYGTKFEGTVDLNGDADWMCANDEPLKGFNWRGGSERETTGILMWSKIFLASQKNGEKVAIILLDTQGTFDSESTVRDCATVFALSTMVSSIQIFNLSQNIQEDDLQHLQLFTEYGKLALADSGSTPFQRLIFLVRDWSCPYEFEYGYGGGQKLLQKRLRASTLQHPELQSIRRHIKSCFSEIGCFLMPHPGLKVATNPKFDGRHSDIEEDFKTNLRELVTLILGPDNLSIKEIGGHKVKAKDLVQYFQSYISAYSGDELPEPKSLLAATAEANNLAAVTTAKDTYTYQMEEFCGSSKPFISPSVLKTEHDRIKAEAVADFKNKRKMGGEEFAESFRIALEEDLEEMFAGFKRYNQSKNFFKSAQTPGVILGATATFYFLSQLFAFITLYSIANACSFALSLALLTLALWSYVRYSGELPEVGDGIDSMTSCIWEGLIQPSYNSWIKKNAINVVSSNKIC